MAAAKARWAPRRLIQRKPRLAIGVVRLRRVGCGVAGFTGGAACASPACAWAVQPARNRRWSPGAVSPSGLDAGRLMRDFLPILPNDRESRSLSISYNLSQNVLLTVNKFLQIIFVALLPAKSVAWRLRFGDVAEQRVKESPISVRYATLFVVPAKVSGDDE
jgi:hypothetical protein